MATNNLNFEELRNRLSSDAIKRIVENLGAKPFYENERYIIFPTICHNAVGGSNKLYYYKDSHKFKCFTQCEGTFDIFELVRKVFALRNIEMNVFACIEYCGLTPTQNEQDEYAAIQEEINSLYNLLYVSKPIEINLPILDKTILNRYLFDEVPLKLWQNEGISFDTMKKFGICFDPIENCIIIPNFDIDNNLISLRGRFLSEDAEAKYKPIIWSGKVLSHPSSMALYGANITKNAMKKSKTAVIFESEKSVLMMDTYYGDKNNSVATLGKNISMSQIQILYKLGVDEVILAYDADYRNYEEMAKKRNEYIRIAKTLRPYFKVAVIMDLDFLLKYKDSPIDRGKEIFEKLLKNKVYI